MQGIRNYDFNIPEPLHLIVISPLMSANPSSGHFYWLYRAFREKSNTIGFDVTCVSERFQDSSEMISILDIRNSSHGVYCAPTIRSIRNFVKHFSVPQSNKKKLFHVYDGGFADLGFVAKISRKFPNEYFLLNLHWANEVEFFLNSEKRSARLQLSLIKMLIRGLKGNLILTAESQGLADLCKAKLNHSIYEYPVMSVFDYSPVKTKDVDFIVVIQDYSNLTEILAGFGLFPTTKKVKVVLIMNSSMRIAREDLKSRAQNISWEVVSRALSRDEYARLFSSAKSVVLPYTSAFYKLGSSGRLLDAYNFGCAAVVPEGLALSSKALTLGNGYIYSPNSPHSLSRALLNSLEIDYSSFNSSHAPTFDNAFSRLIEIVGFQQKVKSNRYDYFRIETFSRVFGIILKVQNMNWHLRDFVLRNGYKLKKILGWA